MVEGKGTSVSIRARVYGIRTFRGRREKKTRGTVSQTENNKAAVGPMDSGMPRGQLARYNDVYRGLQTNLSLE